MIDVPRRPIAALDELLGLPRTSRLLAQATAFRELVRGRTIWNFSSTATGGGVADMLQVLVGYTKDLAIDIRWFVITGDPEFFRITKRVHNRIHGIPGDGGSLGPGELGHIRDVMAENAHSLGDQVHAGDLVLLHDPQTAGLADLLVRRGAHVVWRSHIGIDGQNDLSRSAWDFLGPLIAQAEGFVFTRSSYVPPNIPLSRSWVIPPSIDPFSPKNQWMDQGCVRATLAQIGLLPTDPNNPVCQYTRRDGSPGTVTQPAFVVADQLPGPDEPMVVNVSRWDRLKDMAGVMRAFAEHIAPGGPGCLVLAGPSVDGVTDDPEGSMVFAEILAERQELPPAERSRVILVTLPMGDADDNAAMVNALQRHATVIVQKSLAEGFGLTVAEGMWKARPVVASVVGGIQDQVAEGTGILISDPTDLATFGQAVRTLLDDPGLADQMGAAAQEQVRTHYVGDLHLLRYAELFTSLLAHEQAARASAT
jgi:trehalose synthase